MNEKNTQNAVVPTEDTRQYKHTPKGFKRLTSKIFALLACVLVLVNIAIPCSANGYGTSPYPYVANNLTPNAYVVSGYYYHAVTFPTTYPDRSFTSAFTGNYDYRYNGNLYTDTIVTTSVPNTTDLHKGYVTISPSKWWQSGIDQTITGLKWNDFYWNDADYDELSSSYAPSLSYTFANPAYYRVHITGEIRSAYKPSNEPYTSVDVWLPVDYTLDPTTSFDLHMRDLMARVMTTYNHEGRSLYVRNFNVDIVSYQDEETLTLDNSLVQFNMSYVYASDTPDELYTAPVRFVFPEEVDTSGLFTKMFRNIAGALAVPLIPLGGEVWITLGGLLSVFLGVGLTIIVIKLFMGG